MREAAARRGACTATHTGMDAGCRGVDGLIREHIDVQDVYNGMAKHRVAQVAAHFGPLGSPVPLGPLRAVP
jgi:hypothetical protein